MEIKLIVKEEDKELYEFLKHCKDEKMCKNLLSLAVDLYTFSNGKFDESYGYDTPERLKEKKLSKLSKEEILKLREEYLKNILLYAQDYHPDEVDCGIMRGPDDDYWFIDDGGRLGYITLYANYIKEIDKVLENK